MKNFQVAIDGPAGSGKSSISEMVSKKLGFTHIDTGAMYRAVTLEAMRRNIALDNESQYDFIDSINLVYKDDKTLLEGEDVSSEIRSIPVTNNVSLVCSFKRVRDKMVLFQRESAKEGLVLMDGRDIGTVVLPNANIKIFLTASIEERAKRRLNELKLNGISCDYDSVIKDIKIRDYKDSHREISPLRKASDAIEIDTTNMSIDEVCNKIIGMINERISSMEDNMEDLLAKETVTKPVKVHDIVEGEVVSLEERVAYVDLHQPTEGMIYLNHYNDENLDSFKGVLKVGDIVKAEVTQVEDDKILLSRRNLLRSEKFAELAKKVEETTVDVTARVVRINEKSYQLDFKGIRLYLSKKDVRKELNVNDKIDVRITEVNVEKNFAFCSHYLIVREEREKEHSEYVAKKEAEHKAYEEARAAEFETIQVGDELEGTVVKILGYGILVRFTNTQGLVRMRDLDHNFVKDPNEIVKIGDTVKVKVIKKENNKLELSRKACIASPYQTFAKEHSVGDKITAKVVNKLPFGLLCEVGKDVAGLLHKSEFSWNPNDNLMASVLIGDEIEVAILKMSDETEKISLSKKALIDNPWSRVDAKVGDVVEAEISKVLSNGLRVNVLGVEGFVPGRAVVLDGKSNSIEDYYSEGDKITCVIIELNPRNWRIILDQKAYKKNEERKQFEEYMDNDDSDDEKMTIGDLLKDELKK